MGIGLVLGWFGSLSSYVRFSISAVDWQTIYGLTRGERFPRFLHDVVPYFILLKHLGYSSWPCHVCVWKEHNDPQAVNEAKIL